jgi:polysaccharide export outer membrane protein
MSIWTSMMRLLAVVAALVAAPLAAAAQVPTAPPKAAVPAPAAAPPVPGAPTATPGGVAGEYVLGPDDVIEYGVVGTNDRARDRIYTDGSIQTNLAGRVIAAGKTPRELADQLAKAFKAAGVYSNPVVTVEVVGYASRYVTVLGAVSQPNLVPISRPYRLSEIMARVGGVRADAADYLIVQSDDGKESRYIVDKIAAGGPADDPFVQPGDKIFAPAAELFYISGQVKSPGGYPLRTGMTIAQAIAKAGGLTDSGTDKKVKVQRGGKTVNLKSDAAVEAGDVLNIGERLF